MSADTGKKIFQLPIRVYLFHVHTRQWRYIAPALEIDLQCLHSAKGKWPFKQPLILSWRLGINILELWSPSFLSWTNLSEFFTLWWAYDLHWGVQINAIDITIYAIMSKYKRFGVKLRKSLLTITAQTKQGT